MTNDVHKHNFVGLRWQLVVTVLPLLMVACGKENNTNASNKHLQATPSSQASMSDAVSAPAADYSALPGSEAINLSQFSKQHKTEKRLALIIGNATYASMALDNPINDAKDMAAKLREFGFDVTLILNTKLANMLRAITNFGNKLNDDSVALFYYAGHGIQAQGHNYLVPIGAEITTEASITSEAVDVDSVLAHFFKARLSMVILDACRDNPFEQRLRGIKGGGLAQIPAPKGILIAYATAPGKTAIDGSGHNGLYTSQLLQALNNPGLKVEDVFKETRIHVASISEDQQIPCESSSLVGDFYFSQPQATAADRELSEMNTWRIAEKSNEPGKLHSYLQQYPNGMFAELAQFKLKRMTATHQAFEPEMVLITDGQLQMGSPTTESKHFKDEEPMHTVNITAFAIGKHEVSFAEWDACVADHGCDYQPSDNGWGRGNRPVINVSWNDAQKYVQWLRNKTGSQYRLPSEAEWEYVARANTTGPFSFKSPVSVDKANYNGSYHYIDGNKGEYRRKTVPVNDLPANAWGLYNVHGNVWEWVEDCKHPNYKDAPNDGSAWITTTTDNCKDRMIRGGGWNSYPWLLRSAARNSFADNDRFNYIGFRVAKTLSNIETALRLAPQ